MPIYEYECKACGHQMESIQKISDALLTVCPECGKEDLQKKISASGFRLKGGGWYETDFKKDGKKNLAGDASAPSNTSTASTASTASTTSTATTPKSTDKAATKPAK